MGTGAPAPRSGGRFAFLGFAADRGTKWVAVALGVVAIVFGAGAAGRLGSVQDQNQIDYLPPHAQSTQVQRLEARFPAGQSQQAFVVYHRSSGLTADDLALIQDDRRAVGENYIPDQTPPSPVTVSPNRTTAYFTTTLPLSDGLESIIYEVKKIRTLVGPGTAGMQIAVTGSAAYLADSANALTGKGSTLLLVAVVIAAVLLLAVYRSPVLWVLPLVSVFGALIVAEGVTALLGQHLLTVTGQATGILTVLVIGVGTDYGLLLISRYRQELTRYEDHHQALAVALQRSGPAVVASGATVALSLLCLMASSLTSNQGLGPVCAIGVLVAVASMLVLLPGLLAVLGRNVFWPFVPRPGGPTAGTAAALAAPAAPADPADQGPWARLSRTVAAHRRSIGGLTAVVLVILSLGLVHLHTNLTAQQQFRGATGSVEGQDLLARGFPAGTAAPLVVMVRPAASAGAAQAAARRVGGVASVTRSVATSGGVARFQVVTTDAESTPGADATVVALRRTLADRVGPGALVGGPSAVDYDVRQATIRDAKVVIPLVLVAVLVVLILLLGALVGPLLLVATVVLSFAAALGVAAVADTSLFGFGGTSPYLPLYGFIFLVALGCDYNIFLTARAREETPGHGATEGMRRALATTGAVIASAGLVLAGTFAALAVEPLVVLAELGFLVAVGVLLDTFVVRTFLVPSLAMELGRRWWWPGALSRREPRAPGAAAAAPAAPTAPTVPAVPAVPAAWYPDPEGDPAVVRYWDGSRWTNHTARQA